MKRINSLLGLSNIYFGTPTISDDQILIPGKSRQKQAKCPYCHMKSSSVHSTYMRKLRDLSIGEYSAIIHLRVRKFYCKNKNCERKIFAEQPGKEVNAYARMTQRTRLRLEKILIETSANKGALISRLIQTPVSSSTALRLVRSIPINNYGEVKTLGIDDWAYRKGISYGTILVDMDNGKVIDLLSGRDGKEVIRFLKSHKEVESVCRDRSSSFSAAVNEVLPKAEQIADRFHLVKNLSDSVYKVIREEYPKLVRFLQMQEPVQTKQTKELLTTSMPPQRIKGEPSPHKKQLFSDVKKMLDEGKGYKTIARELGTSRSTVRNYEELNSPPTKSIPLKNNYSHYLELIECSLSKGETLKGTYQAIVSSGFKGSYSAFAEQFKDHPLRTSKCKSNCTVTNAAQKISVLSPRKISIFLALSKFTKIQNERDKAQIRKLVKSNSLIRKLRKQVRKFRDILKNGTPALLDEWMNQTLLLKKKKLNTFVKGLKQDIKAVYNAITSEWSSGMVEGNVNRLKNIKRQMYGRASLELLKRKVILSCTG